MKLSFSIPLYLASVAVCFSILSCKKEAGEGGTSTIRGKVYAYNYADAGFTDLQDSSYTPNEDVYIIYGDDHTTYDNDYKTTYDGTFEFKYLQKGTYKIFTYTKDSTGAASGNVNVYAPKIPVMYTATIKENGETVVIPDLKIIK